MIPLGWREPLMEIFFEKSKQNTFKTLAVSNLSLSFHQLIYVIPLYATHKTIVPRHYNVKKSLGTPRSMSLRKRPECTSLSKALLASRKEQKTWLPLSM